MTKLKDREIKQPAYEHTANNCKEPELKHKLLAPETRLLTIVTPPRPPCGMHTRWVIRWWVRERGSIKHYWKSWAGWGNVLDPKGKPTWTAPNNQEGTEMVGAENSLWSRGHSPFQIPTLNKKTFIKRKPDHLILPFHCWGLGNASGKPHCSVPQTFLEKTSLPQGWPRKAITFWRARHMAQRAAITLQSSCVIHP